MAKFAAQKLGDLLTVEHNAGRVARKCKFVVFAEADDGSWCELDANNEHHARVIADNWVSKLNARGASCWYVSDSGRVGRRKPFHTVFWTGPVDEQ